MQYFKHLLIAVMAVAVTTNPVVASMKLCCSAPKVEKKRSCCRSATTLAPKALCCAKKATSTGVDSPFPRGCCCIKSQDSATSSVRFVLPNADDHSVDLAICSKDLPVPLQTLCNREVSPERSARSGPPLLALYCIWLK